MTSKIEICNMAISAVRGAAIASLTEPSAEAQACSVHYDLQVAATLRDHPWNFTTSYAALAPSPSSAPPYWSGAYGVPAACLTARYILPAARGDAPPPFERAGSLIYTDASNPWLCYTANVTDPNAFDALFSVALSLRLAVAIAPAVTADRGWVQACWTQYLNTIQAAKAVDSSEGVAETPRNPSWLVAAGIDTDRLL